MTVFGMPEQSEADTVRGIGMILIKLAEQVACRRDFKYRKRPPSERGSAIWLRQARTDAQTCRTPLVVNRRNKASEPSARLVLT